MHISKDDILGGGPARWCGQRITAGGAKHAWHASVCDSTMPTASCHCGVERWVSSTQSIWWAIVAADGAAWRRLRALCNAWTWQQQQIARSPAPLIFAHGKRVPKMVRLEGWGWRGWAWRGMEMVVLVVRAWVTMAPSSRHSLLFFSPAQGGSTFSTTSLLHHHASRLPPPPNNDASQIRPTPGRVGMPWLPCGAPGLLIRMQVQGVALCAVVDKSAGSGSVQAEA